MITMTIGILTIRITTIMAMKTRDKIKDSPHIEPTVARLALLKAVGVELHVQISYTSHGERRAAHILTSWNVSKPLANVVDRPLHLTLTVNIRCH